METNFKKWVEIENHYNQKFIDFFASIHSEILTAKYTISEKLDGANFSVIFDRDGTYKFASRNGVIEDGDKFYNYKKAFEGESAKEFLSATSKYCKIVGASFQFVGELFGKGVQKRVNYGDNVMWNWFAVYLLAVDGIEVFINYNDSEMAFLAEDFLKKVNFNINLLHIPIFASNVSLEEALNFDINRNSHYTPYGYDKPNLIEGVVIRPAVNFVSPVGELFILKRKNETFKDRPIKDITPKFNVTEGYASLLERARGYINENRTSDLMSKYGALDNIKNLGDYIKYYMEDFLKDFEKDCAIDYANLSADEQKNIRKAIAGLIKGELFRILEK